MLTGLATTGKPCGDEQHGLVPEAALVVVDPIEVATTRLIPRPSKNPPPGHEVGFSIPE